MCPFNYQRGSLQLEPCIRDMPVTVGDWEIVCISRYLDDLMIWLKHMQTGAEAYVIVPDAPVHLLYNLRSLLC